MRTKVHRRLRERRETERREPKRTQHEPHAARAKARGFITREYQGTMQHREKWPLGSSKAVARADRTGLRQSGRRAASTTGALFHGKLTIRYRKVSTHVVFKMKLSGELRTTP